MSLAIATARPNQALKFGVTFNTHCEDNIQNKRLRYMAQINQAKNDAQTDGSIASIDDAKDPFRVNFRVGQHYAAADIQTRYNGTQCVLTEKGESASQFFQRVLSKIKELAPKLKTNEEHQSEIPQLGNQMLDDFFRALELHDIRSETIQRNAPEGWDSRIYTLNVHKQLYEIIVHREKDDKKENGRLNIHFNKEHHGRLYLESRHGVINRFECEIRDRPTLRLPAIDCETYASPEPSSAIKNLQSKLLSAADALEGFVEIKKKAQT